MPVNWYAALVLIVLLGIGSVVLARVHYAKGTTAVQPTVGQTWHAALAFDICGTTEPALAASPTTGTTGLTSTGSGVLSIAPKTSSEAGNNATLGKFASNFTGLKLTNTSVQYPSGTLYTNGAKCAKGTPDAGKAGVVRVRSWTLSSTTAKGNEIKQIGGKYASKPASLKFKNSQLITVGFGPATKPLPKVSSSIVLALVQTVEGTGTPTTVPVTTATTTPTTAVTPTTAGTTTTTTKPAATTTTTTAKPPSTTTTTKPKS
jgi:hypothetical protein